MTPHTSSSMPCHPEAIVRVKFRDGHMGRMEHKAKSLIWRDRGQPFDIIAYEVLETPDEDQGGAWNAQAGGY